MILRKWSAPRLILVSMAMLPALATMAGSLPVNTGSHSGSDPQVVVPSVFFTENAGQVANEEVRFYLTSGRLQIGLTRDGMLVRMVETPQRDAARMGGARAGATPTSQPGMSVRGVLIRMGFQGAHRVEPRGGEELPHRSNFFLGNDPGNWRTGVRNYRGVMYQDLYDGIDLVWRADDRGLKYEFIVRPGADLAGIRVSYEGAEGLGLDDAGNLNVRTPVGNLRESAPYAYEEEGKEVSCRFALSEPHSYGFECAGWDRSRTLVIDPLVYSTYLGGASNDDGIDIAVDPEGSAYVTGSTWSVDFPVTPGVFGPSYYGQDDAFVSKLAPDGRTLVYSSYLGGLFGDEGFSITVDPVGTAYVTGWTDSCDFPTTENAFDRTLGSSGCSNNPDAFVAMLDAIGSSLIYSTYLGGRGTEYGHGISIDAIGNLYLTGQTLSNDLGAALFRRPEALPSSVIMVEAATRSA